MPMLRISNKGLPVHSLYVGSRDGKAFSDVDRQSVTEVVGNSFDCSTFIDASGHFQGRSVATLLINIATDDGASVEELARSLGKLLDQRVVGIETAGIYRSIYMG
jgi:hypothetical protein